MTTRAARGALTIALTTVPTTVTTVMAGRKAPAPTGTAGRRKARAGTVTPGPKGLGVRGMPARQARVVTAMPGPRASGLRAMPVRRGRGPKVMPGRRARAPPGGLVGAPTADQR